jgi:hypothetical protein
MKTKTINIIQNFRQWVGFGLTPVRPIGVFSLLVALVSVSLTFPAEGQISYSTNGGNLTVTGYSGSGGTINIPAFTNGLPVVAIASFAFFQHGNITNIVIPQSITSIGQAPFDDCQGLKSISVNSSNTDFVSVAGALYNTAQTTLIQFSGGLTGSFTIPGAVANVGYAAFLGSELTAIDVDPSNPNYSSLGGALYNISQTTVIQCPVGVSGSYIIPTTVTTIAYGAFEYCTHITSVSIPASTKSIDGAAFYDTAGMTNIAVDPANSVYSSLNGVLFNKNQTTLIQYALHLGSAYTVPEGVTFIGGNAFADSPSISSVTLPDTVTGIGNGAFFGCGSLKNITFGSHITSIGVNAFDYCPLQVLVIPASVTNLANGAFANCSALKSIYFLGDPPVLGSGVFSGDGNTTVYYLASATGWTTNYGGRPAVLWNPAISTANTNFGVVNGRFGFDVTGSTNFSFIVSACTNLANPIWVPLQTNTLTNASYYFSDPNWSNYPSRFYSITVP